MRESLALERYLQRHIEPDLPAPPHYPGRWKHVLVVPAYDESPAMLDALTLPTESGRILLIVVLNRPEIDSDARSNDALRNAIHALPLATEHAFAHASLHYLGTDCELLLYDLERARGPSPQHQGVGLARKAGCDIALLWINSGCISSQWIANTDADASLPTDYFQRLQGIAATTPAVVFPFRHLAAGESPVEKATQLYELRLHHYVLGLQYANSPYAYHTLGSCIATHASAYAKVRGFPRRSGGEDFYLLNKLAKLGPLQLLQGNCITLQARASHRVPFGTGPAVRDIARDKSTFDPVHYYHPQCFQALRCLLSAVAQSWDDEPEQILQYLEQQDLSAELATATAALFNTMGWPQAAAHCRRQGPSQVKFLRHFHQWFDGFRTLKFIHGLRDAGWGLQTLAELDQCQPVIWPLSPLTPHSPAELNDALARHWNWNTIPGSDC